MAHKPGWIPGTIEGRIALMTKWREGLDETAWRTKYGWAAATCDALIDTLGDAINANHQYELNNSTANRIAKDRLIKIAVQAMRDFANEDIRYNRKMEPEDKIWFNISEKDGEQTDGGEPQTKVSVTDMKPLGGTAVELRFRDEMTPDSWAIPAGYNGALLSFHVGPEKVDAVTLLDQTVLMTHHIFRLELPPAAEGMWLSFAVQWQSHTGKRGLYSQVFHVRVI